VGSRGNANYGESTVISGDTTEPGTIDHDVNPGKRLSGGTVDDLSGDGTGRLLGA
jgi:hypothetical protein